ncbi:hypothetical protein M900_A0302 [Bacteriovorax sp. Seq25_V]|nr:hypothetical protein M900_A0302 [Bacteriovorax sp. Seq25_V]
MDHWDELGIEYKHCFHPESYEWKLFRLDKVSIIVATLSA